MTGDGKAIGSKFGIAFTGKWVWLMKDHIDRSFMKLFNPYYLYNDYDNKKFSDPIENNELFEEERAEEVAQTNYLRERVAIMDAKTAGKILSCDEEETEFFERLFIIDRMGKEE
jgi:selenide,water dikinase